MKTAKIAIGIAAVGLGGFAWYDGAGYRAAVQAYETAAREHAPQGQAPVQADEARYRRCDPMRTENPARNTIDFTAEGRSCLIDALDKTSSVTGALVLLRNASVALSKAPDDRQLRIAAQGAVDKARRILGRDRLLYERQAQIGQAYANSLVVRLLVPPPPQDMGFAAQAALLDEAEYSIHLPQLYQSQQIWRLESLLPEKT